jgi:hypothetical protein
MKTDNGTETRNALMLEHERLLNKLAKWRSETIAYRFLNVFLFMACKILVPTGALIVAVNMVSVVLDKPIISSFASAILAVAVTFLASLEAMLNPGAKKRLAFTLYNELGLIEDKLNIAKISNDNDELKKKMVWAGEEIKRLLNHYAENGY